MKVVAEFFDADGNPLSGLDLSSCFVAPGVYVNLETGEDAPPPPVVEIGATGAYGFDTSSADEASGVFVRLDAGPDSGAVPRYWIETLLPIAQQAAALNPPGPGVSRFGVDADYVRRHYFPQMPGFNVDSNPTEATVDEKVEEAAQEVEAALLAEDIVAADLLTNTDGAYVWCRKTVALASAIACYPVMTGQDPAVLKRWQTDLDARLEDLDERGFLALGTGVSAPAEQPDGPTHFIDSMHLDTSENERRASRITAPFRKDDQL